MLNIMRLPVLLVLIFVFLGLIGYVQSQNVITTTTTRVVTVQPTTIVTEVTVSGTTGTATIQIPGYLLIMESREPGRLCTVYFTAQQPPDVLVFPGTTIPGTTFSTVINQQTLATTATVVEGGTTVSTTGIETVQIVTEGFTLPMPIYGVIREYCERVTITDIITYIVESVPATIRVVFEGFTFPGTTMTVDLPDLEIATTFTSIKTKTGVTERFTTSFPGTFFTTIQAVEPTTYMETVTRPGTTHVETYTTVITLTQTTPATAATTTPITQTGVQTAPQQVGGFGLDLIIPMAFTAVILVVVVVAFMKVLGPRRPTPR